MTLSILSLDGGGMRGLYSATVLRALGERFAKLRQSGPLDIGKGFDLVVGTSTGAILAAGIAAGIPIGRIAAIYERVGSRIFPRPMPPGRAARRWRDKVRFLTWGARHLCRSAGDSEELEAALSDIFGTLTLGQLYERRGIGLAISATRLLQHSPRVFKTPHTPSKDRDDDISVVDACLASSAAPIYLPLAAITEDGIGGQVFADGGLWANNPVLLGLIDGLATAEPDQPIVIVSVGTCPAPVGHDPSLKLARGILEWRAGVLPLTLGMDAQSQAATHAATLLAEQLAPLGKQVDTLRCAESKPSPEQSQLLQLDSTSPKARNLMKQFGNADAHETYRWIQSDDRRGAILKQVFVRMPEADNHTEPKGEKHEGLR